MDGITLKEMTKELCRELFRGYEYDPMIFADMSAFKPYKYSEEIEDYDIIPNSYETIAVSFFLYKEDGEWVIENEKILYGNYYNYAVGCKNKTWGRFPEVDRYDVFDYTICEYAERLYNFGGLPPY